MATADFGWDHLTDHVHRGMAHQIYHDPQEHQAMTDGGEKSDAKEGEDKQFNGWMGTETKFISTRYAGETQTCALSYGMQDLAMVHECAACDLAYTATLSAVDVTVDGGGCGDAASREGEVLFFGHCTLTISLGLNVLYEQRPPGALLTADLAPSKTMSEHSY